MRIAQWLLLMQSALRQQVAVVLVSASDAGEQVRRELETHGLAPSAATGSLAALRRTLVRQSLAVPMVLCITLDDATMRRHGRSLARLLDDRASFLTPVHAIGMTTSGQPSRDWASVGCDAWANDLMDVEHLIERFAAMNATQQADFMPPHRMLSDLPARSRAETREMDLR